MVRFGKLTEKGKKFVSKEISRERRKGTKRDKAVAIAFSKARERGFKTPRRPSMKMLR